MKSVLMIVCPRITRNERESKQGHSDTNFTNLHEEILSSPLQRFVIIREIRVSPLYSDRRQNVFDL
jgi:hypothetical protein